MSFVAEILSSAEKVEIQTLIDKLPEVSAEVDNYKDKVNKYLDGVYVKFTELPRRNAILLQQATKLKNDFAVLQKTADELVKRDFVNASIDLKQISVELEKTNITMSVTDQLISIHEALLLAADLRDTEQYIEAMQELVKTQCFIEAINEDERIEAISKLIIIVDAAKVSLLNKLNEVFKDNIVMACSDDCTMLKVQKGSSPKVSKVLSVFVLCNSCIPQLDGLTRFLWNSVFTIIIDNSVTVEATEIDHFNVLQITKKKKQEDEHYKTVFSNLRSVLNFLISNLDYTLELNGSSQTALSYIGRDLRDNLSELIIKHCLHKTIPSTSEGLEQYKLVIEDTDTLQKDLVKCNIFDENTTSIIEYANNIDILFINKKCQEYSHAALEIMKKDLHDMVEVGVPYDANNPFAELPQSQFPKCAISKSGVELLQLAEKLLQQCIFSSDECSGRLLCTTQNIFHQYGSVISEYHQKLLETIPQQVALFHNNCMYLAHKLTEWNETYRNKLSPLVLIGAVTFKEQAHQLRKVGSDKFCICVTQQVHQIESFMKESGLENLQMVDHLEATVEKSIRQCLRQQELLKTVWHKVLSYLIYNQTLGTIMNSLCTYLINVVLKVEDISSPTAEQLVETYKVVTTRGPKLFTDPKEVCLFVKNWNKLNELIFVLSASLVDIDDRWADGKGPLALQFQPEEVRRLIRALFQNTDRRALVLSKIRD